MIDNSSLIILNILIPVYNRDLDLTICIDSIKRSFNINDKIDLRVYVINDSSNFLKYLEVKDVPFFLEVFNVGENIGKMAAIRAFFSKYNLIGSVVVLDSDDVVQSCFFDNIREAFDLSNSEFISFASNLSKKYDNSVYDTYINFRFNMNNLEDRLDLFPSSVYRDEILRIDIQHNILFPEFLLYFNCFSKTDIFFYNKETIIKNYKDGGYSKSKLRWYIKSTDVFGRYYFLLANASELNCYLKAKSFSKFIFFISLKYFMKFLRIRSSYS